MDGSTFSIVVITVMVLLLAAILSNAPTKNRFFSSITKSRSDFGKLQTTSSIPFILLSNNDDEHRQKTVHKSLQVYQEELHRILEALSKSMDMAISHHSSVAADLLRNRIERLSAIFEHDIETLHALLQADTLRLVRVLPSASHTPLMATDSYNENSSTDENSNNSAEHGFAWKLRDDRFHNKKFSMPYDSIRQIVAHLVRDWSQEGASVRNPLYSWIVSQLNTTAPLPVGPIVVPGAGMGRLAFELALSLGRAVEAVESSITMITMADAVFRMQTTHQCHLHPYAADPFCNEVDSALRYASVSFPDVLPRCCGSRGGSLSFTLAEFSRDTMPMNEYAAAVTCFFLDTASTLFDYLTTIENCLIKGGLFVNVGPLHWHPNSRLPLAVDELHTLLEQQRAFDILHWSVDKEPLRYRDNRKGASTHYDGYLPLRFVLRKR